MRIVAETRLELVTSLCDVARHKSGLWVDEWDLLDHLPEHDDLLLRADDEELHLTPHNFERLAAKLLYRLGSLAGPGPYNPGAVIRSRYSSQPERLALAQRVDSLFAEIVEVWRLEEGPSDPLSSFQELVHAKLGGDADDLAAEYSDLVIDDLHSSPWSGYRKRAYDDTLPLWELFESESLATKYGRFLDQRFIDYLSANPVGLDKMHWRKFEGLTGEYFARTGLHVVLGAGRNDGGIDARTWASEAAEHGPPTMLVQCKRVKRAVEKVVVKALWSDVQFEQADSGVIVTTQRLSPGAREVCASREYPIRAAERETLERWLVLMRTE